MRQSILFLLACTIAAAAATDTQSCSLQCRNGGACTIGAPQFGYAAEMNENDPDAYAYRPPTYSNMFCQCPVGYAGLQCEISLVLCDTDQKLCSNGATCEKAQDDRGGVFRHCECDATTSDLSAAYALHFCRKAAMVFCSTDAQVRQSYCANGGSCRQMVAANQGHKGCDCSSGWEGPHCQFFISNAIPMDSATSQSVEQQSDPSSTSSVLTVVAATCAFLVAVLVGVVMWRSRQKRNQDEHQCIVEMGHNNNKRTEIDTTSSTNGSVRMYGEVIMGSRDIV
ncbi:hypothetical protein MHU86_20501 [Fragilaria crotonensis]|nr:hypothetical protein MHU86_20501 [Fragilaria crotonensis]